MSRTKTPKAATLKAPKTAKAPAAKKATKTAVKKSTSEAASEAKPKKLSAIDAAAHVLAESTDPMNCKALIEAMATKGLWSSPGGKTPAATLYSALLREISVKGAESRFKKTERGHFAANA